MNLRGCSSVPKEGIVGSELRNLRSREYSQRGKAG